LSKLKPTPPTDGSISAGSGGTTTDPNNNGNTNPANNQANSPPTVPPMNNGVQEYPPKAPAIQGNNGQIN
jgi:hypothetical protein